MDNKKLSNKELIEKYGCTVIHVINTENDSEPEFSYSIGLFERFGQPEIIIIGLKQELRHILINNICEDYKEERRLKINQLNDDIIENFGCMVVEVEKHFYKEYLGQALHYYGNNIFPVLQIVYPTLKGFFPWQKEFPKEIKQPILNTSINFGSIIL